MGLRARGEGDGGVIGDLRPPEASTRSLTIMMRMLCSMFARPVPVGAIQQPRTPALAAAAAAHACPCIARAGVPPAAVSHPGCPPRPPRAGEGKINLQQGSGSAGSDAINSLVSNSDALTVYDVMAATGELVGAVAEKSADPGQLIDACTRVYLAEARILQRLGASAAGQSAVDGIAAAAERVRQQAALAKQQLAAGNLPAAVMGLYMAVFIDAVEDLKYAVVGSPGRRSPAPGSSGLDQQRRQQQQLAAAVAAAGPAAAPLPWPLSLLAATLGRPRGSAPASSSSPSQPASV